MASEDAIMVIIKSLMTAEEHANPTSTHLFNLYKGNAHF